MPGTNLTRDEAFARSDVLETESYEVELDLTGDSERFTSRTVARFKATPGADTFIDLLDAEDLTVTLNGAVIEDYDGARIPLIGLAGSNVVEVTASLPYSHSGEGLHRFVDPVDDRVYTYTQFEVPDARRVFACFDQPNLKATFTFTVRAPGDWVTISNSPTPEPQVDGDAAIWRFAPTPRISTYITAVVSGEYHCVPDSWTGNGRTISMNHYCRQSMAHALDHEWIGDITKAGFGLYEEKFGTPYPFEKYDQIWVPEFNAGAMENAGCVTINDAYLPTSRLPRSIMEFRASIVLHELAHMWFGNLVTMQWWEDLWLNESFAEWACYWAETQVTEFSDAWAGFTNARQLRGYRADQLPSTHPIAAPIKDLQAVEVNFDMVTYAKGAAALKQLVAWVGEDAFLAGLQDYFAEFAWRNTTFADLLAALEGASGRDLDGWAAEWLQTPGVNTLAAEFEVTDGAYRSFAIGQSAPAEWPTLRRHRIQIGLYDRSGERIVHRDTVEIDVAGERTEVPELNGVAQPDLLVLNDSDLTFAKVQLDERTLATAIADLSRLDDQVARAVLWTSLWHMTYDGQLAARTYVDLVLRHLGAETDAWAIDRIPSQASMAVNAFSDPARRSELQEHWESGLRRLLEEAEAGSEHQFSFVMGWAAAAVTDSALGEIEDLLDGKLAFDGLEIDQSLRWHLITALARHNRAAERIEAALAEDPSQTARELAAGARAATTTAEAKAEAWQRAVMDPETPNTTRRQIARNFVSNGRFVISGHEDVLGKYLNEYLEQAGSIWSRLGSHMGSDVLEYMFPRTLATPETLAQVDEWLASTDADAAAVRYVAEARDDMARNLRAQERDQESPGS